MKAGFRVEQIIAGGNQSDQMALFVIKSVQISPNALKQAFIRSHERPAGITDLDSIGYLERSFQWPGRNVEGPRSG